MRQTSFDGAEVAVKPEGQQPRSLQQALPVPPAVEEARIRANAALSGGSVHPRAMSF